MSKGSLIHDHPELLGMPEVRKLWQTEGLFSDHYLKARLWLNDWWPTDDEALPNWQFCKALYEKRAFSLRKYGNEMGIRQEFIDKIIEKLGFAWSDNLRLPESQQELEPDYLLYGSPETKEAVLDKEVLHRYQAAIAILEAKKFGHPLSQISKRQQRYPHQQIRDYLNEAQALTWGILTNGNEWRLYCRDTKPSHFFGINFELAIRSLQEFKFFLALFSPAAFLRDAQGKCRLDQVRENALATQSELEADLRERIFTIVEILANGYVERPENKITDADLPRLYENCLIFLYRLLFILYAEGRSLLPVEPKSGKYYKQLSLTRLLKPLKNFAEYDSQTQTRFYRDIQALCLVINGSDKKANDEFRVPRYNGGLFDPDRYPLLREWAVADAVLADVLRQLMFTPQKGGQKFVPFESVDYSDLSVRQLGSIYEGLLEHHFVREGGQLVLKTDKAGRKATGTYYTPDYIVRYIVEQTFMPLLQEIEQQEPVKAARASGKQDDSFANAVLALNVCDPAMGSGHFVVEATMFLADHIVYHPTTKFHAKFVKGESQEETEIAYWRRRVVEACIYGVDLNPLAVELAKLSLWLTTISTDQPLNFLDHHLCCGNSLVGAQLEELARVPDKKGKSADGLKLSWKITENLRASLTKAVQMVHNIEGAPSTSVSEVKNKEKLWRESVRPALLPFRTVANLWTACFFGNDLPQRDYEALIELLDIHPDKIRPWQNAAEFQAIVMKAIKKGSLKLAGGEFDTNQLKDLCSFLFRSERSAAERRFFHWELEFPEVFFNDDATPRERPGFDAVIGNPPYVRQEGLGDEKPLLLAAYDVYHGTADLYVFFIERGLDLLRRGGQFGMITSNKFMRANYGAGLRAFLGDKAHIRQMVDFAMLPVFRGITVRTAIMLIENSFAKSRKTIFAPVRSLDFTSLENEVAQVGRELPADAFSNTTWSLASEPEARVLEKMKRGRELLSKYAAGEIRFGIKTGFNEAFVIDAATRARLIADDPQSAEIIKPVLEGSDIGRYTIDFNERFLIWTYIGIEMSRYPAITKYLSKFRDRLETRWDKGDKWFELRTCTYYQQFEQPKIIYPDIAQTCRFSYDHLGYFSTNTIYFIPRKDFYLLAILNSCLSFFYFKAHCAALEDAKRNAYLRFFGQYMEMFPVRSIAFTTPERDRRSLFAKARQFYKASLAHGNVQGVLAFLAEQLAAKPERGDVVHDLLAFLAEEMTNLNLQKRATANQFLTGLRDFQGIDSHALSPKGKLDEFWKLDTFELFAHFRANKLRIKDSEEEKIRGRFEKAKEELVPLEAQIAFTDDLIDQIVFRLYGLTPEEIKIVEDSLAC